MLIGNLVNYIKKSESSMNKKQTHTLTLLALVFGVAISPILAADNVEARIADSRYVLQGDLTAPNNDKPFGGENAGTYNISVRDDYTIIVATLQNSPSNGMVHEGWLVDVETGEKLSTGVFNGNKANSGTFLIDPEFHYDVFVVTEEPIIDSDPTPNKPVAGVPLSTPFGQ